MSEETQAPDKKEYVDAIRAFTPDDLKAIGDLSRNHKFSYPGSEILYPRNAVDRLRYVVLSVRFILDLREQVETAKGNSELALKLSRLYKEYEELSYEAHRLLIKNEAPIEYGRHRIIMRLNDLFLANQEKIGMLMSFIYPLSHNVKTTDPSEVQAYG